MTKKDIEESITIARSQLSVARYDEANVTQRVEAVRGKIQVLESEITRFESLAASAPERIKVLEMKIVRLETEHEALVNAASESSSGTSKKEQVLEQGLRALTNPSASHRLRGQRMLNGLLSGVSPGKLMETFKELWQ